MSLTLRSRVPVLVAVVLAVLSALPNTAAPSPASHVSGPRPRVSPPAPAPLTAGERAAQYAVDEVGVPYHWGGDSPAMGFDCSGLVRWAYGRVGIDLPHSSYALSDVGRRVSSSGMEPGDILVFEGLGHVGIYLGRGRMVHAPQTGRNVEIVRLGNAGYGARIVAARRIGAD
jgi:cell wall-associated NlpC family hydrolase